MIPQKAVPIKLLQKQVWREGLVSLRFEKPDSFTFKPGQFVRLGIEKDFAEGAAYEGRPYSMASLPEDPFLEFFIVEVQGGRVSGALTALEPGQSCYLEPELWGSMLPERIPGGNTLWCISSGTGLAPFMSILQDESVWKQWPNIVLVHSVRYSEDLAYTNLIQKFTDDSRFGANPNNSFCYVPAITREATQFLSQRIPALIESGDLEATAERKLDPVKSRVLLCGNPEMLKSARNVLKTKGFVSPRRGQPGNLLAENLW